MAALLRVLSWLYRHTAGRRPDDPVTACGHLVLYVDGAEIKRRAIR